MALPVKTQLLTPEEYLRIEREAAFKSEFYAGEMFAMAGGSSRHSLIAANVTISLGTRLRGHRCTSYQSDLRIGIPGDDLYTYPDLSIFCEPLEFMPGTDDTAINPTIIVEVLSKSTEAYDRGRKFEHYRTLPSLREYVLVSQDAPIIERFTREGDGRRVLTDARGLDGVLRIEAIDSVLPLAEVYEKVSFPGPEPSPGVPA